MVCLLHGHSPPLRLPRERRCEIDASRYCLEDGRVDVNQLIAGIIDAFDIPQFVDTLVVQESDGGTLQRGRSIEPRDVLHVDVYPNDSTGPTETYADNIDIAPDVNWLFIEEVREWMVNETWQWEYAFVAPLCGALTEGLDNSIAASRDRARLTQEPFPLLPVKDSEGGFIAWTKQVKEEKQEMPTLSTPSPSPAKASKSSRGKRKSRSSPRRPASGKRRRGANNVTESKEDDASLSGDEVDAQVEDEQKADHSEVSAQFPTAVALSSLKASSYPEVIVLFIKYRTSSAPDSISLVPSSSSHLFPPASSFLSPSSSSSSSPSPSSSSSGSASVGYCLCVSDGGSGISRPELPRAMTVASDPSKRLVNVDGPAPVRYRHVTRKFNMYGMGLKAMVFTLGETMNILTRKVDTRLVAETYMNKESMVQRQRDRDRMQHTSPGKQLPNAWELRQVNRPPADLQQCLLSNELKRCAQLAEMVEGEVATAPRGFTTVVVSQLRSDIVKELDRPPGAGELEGMKRLSMSLAHVYHFCLFGPYGLNFLRVIPGDRVVPTAPLLPWHEPNLATVTANQSLYGVASVELSHFFLNRITLRYDDSSVSGQRVQSFDLQTELSNLRAQYQLGGHHYILFFAIRITTDSPDGKPTIVKQLEGELRYFFYDGLIETRPRLRCRQRENGRDTVLVEDDEAKEEKKAEGADSLSTLSSSPLPNQYDNMFDLVHSGRGILNSSHNSLPFIDELTVDPPQHWTEQRSRLKGTLFLCSDHISVNSEKTKVKEGDLVDLLTDRPDNRVEYSLLTVDMRQVNKHLPLSEGRLGSNDARLKRTGWDKALHTRYGDFVNAATAAKVFQSWLTVVSASDRFWCCHVLMDSSPSFQQPSARKHRWSVCRREGEGNLVLFAGPDAKNKLYKYQAQSKTKKNSPVQYVNIDYFETDGASENDDDDTFYAKFPRAITHDLDKRKKKQVAAAVWAMVVSEPRAYFIGKLGEQQKVDARHLTPVDVPAASIYRIQMEAETPTLVHMELQESPDAVTHVALSSSAGPRYSQTLGQRGSAEVLERSGRTVIPAMTVTVCGPQQGADLHDHVLSVTYPPSSEKTASRMFLLQSVELDDEKGQPKVWCGHLMGQLIDPPGGPRQAVFRFDERYSRPTSRELGVGTYRVRFQLYVGRSNWSLPVNSTSIQDRTKELTQLREWSWSFHLRCSLLDCMLRFKGKTACRVSFGVDQPQIDFRPFDAHGQEVWPVDMEQHPLDEMAQSIGRTRYEPRGLPVRLEGDQYEVTATARLVLLEADQPDGSTIKEFWLRDLTVDHCSPDVALSCMEPRSLLLSAQRTDNQPAVQAFTTLLLPGEVAHLSLAPGAELHAAAHTASYSSADQQGDLEPARSLTVQGLPAELQNGDLLPACVLFLQDKRRQWTSTEAEPDGDWLRGHLRVYALWVEADQPAPAFDKAWAQRDLNTNDNKFQLVHDGSIGHHCVQCVGSTKHICGFHLPQEALVMDSQGLGRRGGSGSIVLYFMPFYWWVTTNDSGWGRVEGMTYLRHHVTIRSRGQPTSASPPQPLPDHHRLVRLYVAPTEEFKVVMVVKDECGLPMLATEVKRQLTEVRYQLDSTADEFSIIQRSKLQRMRGGTSSSSSAAVDPLLLSIPCEMSRKLGVVEQLYTSRVLLCFGQQQVEYCYEVYIVTKPSQLTLPTAVQPWEFECGEQLSSTPPGIEVRDAWSNLLQPHKLEVVSLSLPTDTATDPTGATIFQKGEHVIFEHSGLVGMVTVNVETRGRQGEAVNTQLQREVHIRIRPGTIISFAAEGHEGEISLPAVSLAQLRLTCSDGAGHLTRNDEPLKVQVKLLDVHKPKRSQPISCTLWAERSTLDVPAFDLISADPSKACRARMVLSWKEQGQREKQCTITINLRPTPDLVTAIVFRPADVTAGQPLPSTDLLVSLAVNDTAPSTNVLAQITASMSCDLRIGEDNDQSPLPSSPTLSPLVWDQLRRCLIGQVRYGEPLQLAASYRLEVSCTPRNALLLTSIVDKLVVVHSFVVHSAAARRLYLAPTISTGVISIKTGERTSSSSSKAIQSDNAALQLTVLCADEYDNVISLTESKVSDEDVTVHVDIEEPTSPRAATSNSSSSSPPRCRLLPFTTAPRRSRSSLQLQSSDAGWTGPTFSFGSVEVDNEGAIQIRGLFVSPPTDAQLSHTYSLEVACDRLSGVEPFRIPVVLADDSIKQKLKEVRERLKKAKAEHESLVKGLINTKARHDRRQRQRAQDILELETKVDMGGQERNSASRVTAKLQECKVEIAKCTQSLRETVPWPVKLSDKPEDRACRDPEEGYVGRLCDVLEADSVKLSSLLTFVFYATLFMSYFTVNNCDAYKKMRKLQREKSERKEKVFYQQALNNLDPADTPEIPTMLPHHRGLPLDQETRTAFDQRWKRLGGRWLTSCVRLMEADHPLQPAYARAFANVVVVEHSEEVPQYVDDLNDCKAPRVAIIALDTFDYTHLDGSSLPRTVNDEDKKISNKRGMVMVSTRAADEAVERIERRADRYRQLSALYNARDNEGEGGAQMERKVDEAQREIDRCEKEEQELLQKERAEDVRRASLAPTSPGPP